MNGQVYNPDGGSDDIVNIKGRNSELKQYYTAVKQKQTINSPSKSPAIRFGQIRRDLKNNQLSTISDAKYRINPGLFPSS